MTSGTGEAGVVSGSASQFPCQSRDWLWVGSHSSLAACVVDFIMDNVYSISLSKKRLPDGQAHDCTELDSWASLLRARLPRNAIYTRNQRPFKSGISKAREKAGLSEGSVTNSKESQSQANLTFSPTSQSEAIKNNSTKQKNKLKGKKGAHLGGGKKKQTSLINPTFKFNEQLLQHQRRMHAS